MGGKASKQELSAMIMLRPTESVLGIWWGTRGERNLTFAEALGEQGKATALPNSAYAVLTNERLALIAEKGLVGSTKYVQDMFGLEDIAGVSGPVKFGGFFLSVTRDSRSFERFFRPRESDQHLDPHTCNASVQNAIRSRHSRLEEEKKRDRVQYVLDFSFLKDKMERGGLTIATIKCPSCSSPLRLPDTGSQTRCDSCGSQILAQDIFEKFRGFVGSLP
jgi:hypothetical protein